MKPETLIKAWNSTRDKQTRLQIIDNAYCPDELIHRALFLYDPDIVLNLPNLAVKAMWSEDPFIQMCFSIKQGKHTFRPLGYHYYWGSAQNKVLLYLETIYSTHAERKRECISSINNKLYISRLFKLHPELLNLTLDNTHLSYNLTFHLYSKDVLSLEKLLHHCIDYGPVSTEKTDYAEYTPEFSVTAVNSIKKLCTNTKFESLAFQRLFEIFVAGETTSALYRTRMHTAFKDQIYKYKPEWQNKFWG